MKASVIGAAGYAGGELLRLLLAHPSVTRCTAVSRSQAGKGIGEVHPGLAGLTDARFAAIEPGEAVRSSDVVFLALEHGESSRLASQLFPPNHPLIIDLSADFRVQDAALYERYYGAHQAADFLSCFRYGLADIVGTDLRGARAIAVPGCFATAAQLALYPLAGIPGLVPTLFALTGSSGGGVHPKPTAHHPARANNVFAYSVLGHRHEAELLEQWRRWTNLAEARVRLMTHSGPFVRGIYLTLSGRVTDGAGLGGSTTTLYERAYRDRPFVRLTPNPPELTHVVGTNNALIHAAESDDGSEVQVSVAIDNLIKGAAGQAVQAMNLALDLPEDAGLRVGGMFPC